MHTNSQMSRRTRHQEQPRIMAVVQEATGADFKDKNINIVQSQHIIILVSNTGLAEERMSADEEKRGKNKPSESVGVQN